MVLNVKSLAGKALGVPNPQVEPKLEAGAPKNPCLGVDVVLGGGVGPAFGMFEKDKGAAAPPVLSWSPVVLVCSADVGFSGAMLRLIVFGVAVFCTALLIGRPA